MIKAVIFDMYETLITHSKSPLYFGKQIAEDLGIAPESFYPLWHASEDARTRGERTTESVIAEIMKENGRFSEDALKSVMEKRRAVKRGCFLKMDEGILPLLSELKGRGIALGLISNCFSEEAEIIRESPLFPFFDSAMLSYEQRLAKPDREIFTRCLAELSLSAEECLYVGDDGSMELEAAQSLGMRPVQALWYLRISQGGESAINSAFPHAEAPKDVLDYLD